MIKSSLKGTWIDAAVVKADNIRRTKNSGWIRVKKTLNFSLSLACNRDFIMLILSHYISLLHSGNWNINMGVAKHSYLIPHILV